MGLTPVRARIGRVLDLLGTAVRTFEATVRPHVLLDMRMRAKAQGRVDDMPAVPSRPATVHVQAELARTDDDRNSPAARRRAYHYVGRGGLARRDLVAV